MSPTKRPAPNAGVQAKQAKKLLEAAAMIERMTAELKETREELAVLKQHSAAQDQARRTDETRHSEELVLILAELKKLASILSIVSNKD